MNSAPSGEGVTTPPTDDLSPETTHIEYVVELFGRVHVRGCPTIPNPRMTWPWRGVNNMAADNACGGCLPAGLPCTPPTGGES